MLSEARRLFKAREHQASNSRHSFRRIQKEENDLQSCLPTTHYQDLRDEVGSGEGVAGDGYFARLGHWTGTRGGIVGMSVS